MTTLARKVVEVLASEYFVALSLYAGYAQRAVGGAPVKFQGGSLISEKRNPQGRMVRSRYVYADGSLIEYTWTERSGPKVKEV